MDTPSTSTTTPATTTNNQKPKIDPLQLLKCLSILLNPRGGIRGETEVQRVKGLMAKYSKKLVSKCIYLNILQATDIPLLDLFYEEGGWELVGLWLQEAVNSKNWPLATQVLNLLETSPMTVARLKRNTTPKLVKELSKESTSPGVQLAAKQLVLKWMEVVRQGDGVATAAGVGLANYVVNSADEDSVEAPGPQAETPKEPTAKSSNGTGEAEVAAPQAAADSSQGEGGDGSSSLSCQDESSNTSTESDNTPLPTTPIRITIRSGSQVLAKVSSQRHSQDSTDSDDNKPLSVIKQEVAKARTAATVVTTGVGHEDKNDTAVEPMDTGDNTNVAAPVETDGSGSGKSQVPVFVSVSSAVISTAATTTTTTLTTTTLPATESVSATKAPAVHTIVTFTGSLAASAVPVASQGGITPSPPSDAKPQSAPETENKGNATNGTNAGNKTESVSSLSTDEVDSCDKSEDKSEVKSDVKNEKDKKNDSSKYKDKNKDKDRERDKKLRESDKKKDKDRNHKGRSSSMSSNSSKCDRERDKSSKDHSKSRSNRHRRSDSRDKDRKDRDRSKSSKDKKSSSRDKDRHKDKDKDKDKREDKKKKEQENEDKATLEKVKPLSVDGLAKIPRKSTPASFLDALGSADVDLQESKKPSVKTYKSRGFRNTGLLDEPTKLPGVAGKKPSGTGTGPNSGMKRTTPLEDLASTPPDKRVRSSVSSLPLSTDKPGGVKLISPKRPSLSDDGGFMAALTAAGPETRKKVTRKRKSSESDPKDPKSEVKEEDKKEEDATSPASSPTKAEDKSVMLSPTSVRPTFNFYQETLKDDDDEDKTKAESNDAEKTEGEEAMEAKNGEEGSEENHQQSESQDGDVEMKEEGNGDDLNATQMELEETMKDDDIPRAPAVPAPAHEDYEKVEVTFSSPNPESIRSVLVYHRPVNRKKKSVKWKTEDDLKEVFLFELDETERVNVNTIKFNELMVMEKQREREAMGKSRVLPGHVGALGGGMNNAMGDEHMMGNMSIHPNHINVQEYMRWSLLPVNLTGQPNITPGCRSQERVIQATRESSTMAAFFHPAMLPDTPREPDPELVVRAEPKEVPLHDVSGQDNMHDHRNKLWPEPIINDPMNYGYGGIGSMGNMGGMSGGGGGVSSGSGSSGGGSHWVIGGPPSGGFAAAPMYGGHAGPGVGPTGPGGYGGPGHGNYGGDMGGGMDGPGWGGPGPDYSGQNMMMGSGGQGMMMGPRPNMGPRGMMPNVGMGGGPRFRGRGGGWGPRGTPPPCKHFMNGHCRHGKNCKFLHAKQY
ncbi:serine/threonine-protein phosphatase 1 regulatory subunit 10-like isoform X2 [Homarus americanus]|uniref:serine/threonine-protein phosphatase 1 regulatory subunit 10-like isoform X2 n=1 Tax=Homarus americanus TaxID=6706 RepID=UPI001C47DB3C|nr:serine/threonine-protein phosphatase 1 regulatory subunit 10-like isoform X2 [Homarus americanus]